MIFILRSTYNWGCRGQSSLPEYEAPSPFALPRGGTAARKKKYECMPVLVELGKIAALNVPIIVTLGSDLDFTAGSRFERRRHGC
jgi:hypothetical protein